MVLGDTVSGEILHEIEAPEGRHFYGHGVFPAMMNIFIQLKVPMKISKVTADELAFGRLKNH